MIPGLFVSTHVGFTPRATVPAAPVASPFVFSPAATMTHQFGTYAAGPRNTSWLSFMHNRYGAVTLAVPAWGADLSKVPPVSVFGLAASEGVYAALSVCAYESDWVPGGRDGWRWNKAMGTTCVQHVAHELGSAAANVQAVLDGSQIDQYATPAQQVYMYDLMKEYFPNADVVSFHAGEMKQNQSQPMPGQSDGGYGSAGRSNDVVLLGDAQGTDTYARWQEAAQVLAAAEAKTGPVRLIVMRNSFRLTTKVVTADLSEIVHISATTYPVWGYEIRSLQQLNAPTFNLVSKGLKDAVAEWLG